MKTKRKSKFARVVKERDRGICQCCYACSTDVAIEVHHIQPLWLGGADEPGNMVCLCKKCHRHAPDDPEMFLQYQRRRGSRGAELLGRMLADPPGRFHCKNQVEMIALFEEFMQLKFDMAWSW